MVVRAAAVCIGLVLAACSGPSTDSSSPMPIKVESVQFPSVEIECRGDGGLSKDDCLHWAEQMLPAAPTRPSGEEAPPVVKLVLTQRAGNGRCAADYFAADGRLVMTMAARCPSDASPEPTGDLVGTLQGDRDLEVGCAWLVDSTGKQWEILWPEGYRIAFPAGRDPVLTGPGGEVVARAGDVIAVDGAPPSGLGSFCMVGELFEATRIVDVQPRSAEP